MESILTVEQLAFSVLTGLGIGITASLFLLAKSVRHFSQSGPQLRDEIVRSYFGYTLFALVRLGLWTWLITSLLASIGIFLYLCLLVVTELEFSLSGVFIAGALSLLLLTAGQFLKVLLYLPGLIVASSHYKPSRFYKIWRKLTPRRLRTAQILLWVVAGGLTGSAAWQLAQDQAWMGLALIMGTAAIYGLGLVFIGLDFEPRPKKTGTADTGRPNIIMIGCDTLRSDRIGAHGYHRPVTPFIDSLIRKGTSFMRCYVPLARTAPSLVSLFTGCWPHRHGIRTNYVADQEKKIAVPALPAVLAASGYRTATISDWCGSDLGKFEFGFQDKDLPEDQWNFKYLIRQGPKDIRLFLSLFTHNRFGKTFLPEIYYLAGVPLGRDMGRSARRCLADFAAQDRPFLLNVFMSHTHPPFASEYPYYLQFSDPDYRGESKFAMRRLTDPFEVIRSQAEPKKAFDLEQINDLYDGAVRSFDDEVARIMGFVEDCGLADNTIVVIYSDHGMDLFEHNTWGQGNSILGDSNRIPLIIVDPRRQGRGVIKDVVRSIDLTPTLLELVGQSPIDCDGRSLAPYLREETVDMQLHGFAETGLWLTRIPGMHPDHLDYPSVLDVLEVPDRTTGTLAVKAEFKEMIDRARDRMVVNNRWKLTYMPLRSGGYYQLFDLDRDPECRIDVAVQYPEIAEALRARLDEWIAATDGKVCRALAEVPVDAGENLVVSVTGKVYRPNVG